jgi:hypothetical protein
VLPGTAYLYRLLFTFSLTIFQILHLSAAAPSWEWAVKNDHFHISGIKTDRHSNMFVTGYFYDTLNFSGHIFISQGNDFIVAKYDTSGNCLWAKQFGGALNETSSDLVIDGMDNVWVTGHFDSKQLLLGNTLHYNKQQQPGPATWDIFLLKLASNGAVIYSATYGSVAEDRASDIAIDGSGNIAICGSIEKTTIFGGYTLFTNNTTFNSDILIVKFNSGGNVLWAKCFGHVNLEGAHSIAADTHGNFIFSALFSTSLTIGTVTLHTSYSNDIFDLCIVKLDPNGNLLWADEINGSWVELTYDLTTDFNDNIILSGMFSEIITLGSNTYTAYPNGTFSQSFLVKYDKNGSVQWSSVFTGAGANIVFSLACDKGSNIYFTGSFTNDTLLMNGIPLYTLNDSIGGVVVKLLPNGAADWLKPIGGINERRGRKVAISDSGDVYFAGTAKSESYFDNDTLTNSKWFCSFARMHVYTAPVTTAGREVGVPADIKVYPVPSTDRINIDAADKYHPALQYTVTEISGKILMQGNFTTPAHIDVSDLPEGMYLLRIANDDTDLLRKLIVQ